MIKRFGSYLSCTFIAIFAVIIGFLFQRYNFQGLNAEALNCAQLARNIAQGHGFSTNVIGISQVAQFSPTADAPDLLHAPFFPFVLGWVFTVAGARDSAIINFSLTLFVLSTVILFVLTKRLLQRGWWAAVVAVAFALSFPVLAVASSGLPQALSGFLLLLMLLVLTPKPEIEDQDSLVTNSPAVKASESDASQPDSQDSVTAIKAEGRNDKEAPHEPAKTTVTDQALPILTGADENFDIKSFYYVPPPPPKDRRLLHYFAVGLLAALCYLTDYVSVFYVVPLALFWGEGLLGWKWRRVALFVVGFLLIAGPWWFREGRLIGNPFYSIPWLILGGQLDSISGLWSHVQQQGIGFFYGMTSAPHLYLMPFFVLSLWLRPEDEIVARCKTATWIGLILALVGFSVFSRDTPVVLVPLASLLTLIGFATFFQIATSTSFFESVVERLMPALNFEPTLEDPSVYRTTVKDEAVHPSLQRFRLNVLALFRMPLVLRASPTGRVLYLRTLAFGPTLRGSIYYVAAYRLSCSSHLAIDPSTSSDTPRSQSIIATYG